MQLRGIRGAITVPNDTPNEILSATKELLGEILEANPFMESVNIASAIFTVTHDLKSVFPAQAARELGWKEVPLMCMQEIPVPGSLPNCIRVLLHVNTDLEQKEINHIYLREAKKLRPDLEEKTK